MGHNWGDADRTAPRVTHELQRELAAAPVTASPEMRDMVDEILTALGLQAPPPMEPPC